MSYNTPHKHDLEPTGPYSNCDTSLGFILETLKDGINLPNIK
jgi:hypothetical protein